jgi:hypothetical protein
MCALLEAADGAHQRQLHVEGQAGGDAVGIDLVRGQPLGLDEDLMRVLVGEAVHLVLDGRAVARADALDHAGVHRRAVEPPRMISWVRALVWVMKQATWRGMFGALPRIGEHRHGVVAGLLLHHAVVEAAAVDARRRAGLEPLHPQRQLAQAPGQGVGGRVAGAAAS